MVCGFVLNLVLWLQSLKLLPNPLVGVHFPAVAFTWYVLIGAIVTFAVGSVGSFLLPAVERNVGKARVLRKL